MPDLCRICARKNIFPQTGSPALAQGGTPVLCCAHRQRLAPSAHPQNVLCCLESVACPIRAGGCFVCAGGSRGQYAQLLRRFCALCASVAGLLRCFRSKMSKSPPGFYSKMSNSPLGVLNIFVRNLHPTRANPLKIEQVRTAYIFVHRQKALPAAKPFSKFPETAKQRAQPTPRPSPPPAPRHLHRRASRSNNARSSSESRRSSRTMASTSLSIRGSPITIGFSVYSSHSLPPSVVVIVSTHPPPFLAAMRPD